MGANKWFQIYSGNQIFNPINFAHRFCLKGKTEYYFIVVQSLGIDHPNYDDFILVQILV